MRVEPAVKRAAAFVDGQNLFYAAKDAFGYPFPNYDPRALASHLCAAQNWQLDTVRWIFGSERDATWTQKLHGNHSQKFQNPLRQNYKHTKTLAGLLELPEDVLVSVVVFIGNTIFKTALPANVTYPLGCTRLIKARQDLVLPPDEVARVLATIESMRLKPGWETHRAHVAYLHEKHGQPSTPMRAAPAPPPFAPPKTPAGTPLPKASLMPDAPAPERDGRACPRCGQPLVLRTARQGRNAGQPFWGCQGFPKCRYTAEAESA